MKEVEQTLEKFYKKVRKDARSNLTRYKKNASRKLYKSLDYEIESDGEKTDSGFWMEEHGIYQDQGVSGTERKFNTPFKYTNKKPPTSAFSSWSVIRGIAPRDPQGRFTSRRAIQFAVANWIYKMGIEPSLFFTKPFEREFRRLPEEIQKAVSMNVEDRIKINFNI